MKREEIGMGYHILTKPIGSICNLRCDYCFYLEKQAILPMAEHHQMSDDVLEAFIKKYIQTQPNLPEIQFVWQGGEPTLLGISFFRKVVSLQQKYAGSQRIVNSIQTNGLLIDKAWCEFLKVHHFLVGISLDGPSDIHDVFRKHHDGSGTHAQVENAVKLMQRYGVAFNVLSCISSASVNRGAEIYAYFKALGVKYLQFSPIVERIPSVTFRNKGYHHASPYDEGLKDTAIALSAQTVPQGAFGQCLIDIFESWVRHDVGQIYVMNFEWALEAWLGLPSTVCLYSKTCGGALAIEKNGDLYGCDHYVFPENRLGNILTDNPLDLIASKQQRAFGMAKTDTLPMTCHHCEVRFACHGECPRHRFMTAPGGEVGLSYLCKDYKSYFTHIHRYMKVMVQLIEQRLPASKIMAVIEAPLIIER